jgi:3-O-methylgallate 3,4-dioxygenase
MLVDHACTLPLKLFWPEGDCPVSVVPVCINTVQFPLHKASRVYAMGKAVGEAIRSWDSSKKVAVVASGGLSHFVVDEALDQQVITAIRNKDSATLAALDPKLLQAGSSEIRNWLVVGEMARDLDVEWVEYVPGYRTPALTGTGLAFAAWRTLF